MWYVLCINRKIGDVSIANFKKYKFEFLLVLPMVLYLVGFTLIPVVQTILLGFKDRYTGAFSLSTYAYLFNRPSFVSSIFNTINIAIISLILQLSLGMIIALVLKKKFAGREFVRALIMMPMGIPTLVSAVMALHIFGTSGYLNEVLFRMFGLSATHWLSGGWQTLFIIAFADTWKVLPMIVLLLLAGLEAIPNAIYEAAAMDGSSTLSTFFRITLPMLKSSITMSVLFRAVAVFRIFEMPQVLVGKSIPFVATYAYEEYALGNVNASGAASTLLLVLIFVFAILYMTFIDKGEGFNDV